MSLCDHYGQFLSMDWNGVPPLSVLYKRYIGACAYHIRILGSPWFNGNLIKWQGVRTSRLRNNFATHYFVMGFNCAITFIACSKRFELLEYASQGFEWVNYLSFYDTFTISNASQGKYLVPASSMWQRRRVDGWVFEARAQYPIPKPISTMDQVVEAL
ncbi:uncharacterized protein LACBIDRAFT_333880 [Laccaria bicolor S238N-H82]|uniref:Predicted protein n=1 Tax=Laccaria bicolor (strain S238N-H82 / ATCC MYA-4686) TaxID=486041 RepID=B0DXD9_LACBS|nr:uncharacterized protein LACBIDRAFT_333880 [Laccaria bicolor S238N-H82]EDR00819.1 predicted protein [Laccaria bicolor S238N-H82]|eukprot:XP_001888611.1 predicted protein [Laccaria bicolor S238N-H82]